MNNKYVTKHLIASVLSMLIGGCSLVFNWKDGDAFTVVIVFFIAIFYWVISILVLVLMKNYFVKKRLTYFCPIFPGVIFLICSLLFAKEERMIMHLLTGIATMVNIAFFIIDIKRSTIK